MGQLLRAAASNGISSINVRDAIAACWDPVRDQRIAGINVRELCGRIERGEPELLDRIWHQNPDEVLLRVLTTVLKVPLIILAVERMQNPQTASCAAHVASRCYMRESWSRYRYGRQWAETVGDNALRPAFERGATPTQMARMGMAVSLAGHNDVYIRPDWTANCTVVVLHRIAFPHWTLRACRQTDRAVGTVAAAVGDEYVHMCVY